MNQTLIFEIETLQLLIEQHMEMDPLPVDTIAELQGRLQQKMVEYRGLCPKITMCAHFNSGRSSVQSELEMDDGGLLKGAIVSMAVGINCYKRLTQSISGSPELSPFCEYPPKGYAFRVLLLSRRKDSLVLLKDDRVETEIQLNSVKMVEPTRQTSQALKQGSPQWCSLRVVSESQVTEFAVEGVPAYDSVVRDIRLLVRHRRVLRWAQIKVI